MGSVRSNLTYLRIVDFVAIRRTRATVVTNALFEKLYIPSALRSTKLLPYGYTRLGK